MVAVVGAKRERSRILKEFVELLDRCDLLQQERGMELLHDVLRDRFGTSLAVRQQSNARTKIVELVRACSQLDEGLEVLVDAVEFLVSIPPGRLDLHCLCDEWHAMRSFLGYRWAELRAILRDLRLRGPDEDEAHERPLLRHLVLIASDSRIVELPEHCRTAWHTFLYLAGANSAPGALRPCMTFLDCVAERIQDQQVAQVLRNWNRYWANELKLTPVLEAAAWRIALRKNELGTAYLLIQIDPHPKERDQLSLSYWYHSDPKGWRPSRRHDREVSMAKLARTIDEILGELETRLGARTDAQAGAIQIEFILPADLLNLPVELWLKYPSSPDPVPFAIDHPVVVRSLERLRTPRLHHPWRRRWQVLATERVRSFWSRPSGADYFVRLAAELSSDERIASLVLSEPPDPDNETAQHEINVALQVGLPAIIWHRKDCSAQAFRDAVTTMLADGQFTRLPQQVAALRQEAFREVVHPNSGDRSSHPGKYLVILWDDPGRLPESSGGSA